MKKAIITILSFAFAVIVAYPAFANITTGTWTDITYNEDFNTPQSLSVDSSGNVYVVDYKNTVKVLENEDDSWKDITFDGSFSHPSGIDVDSSGNVYVSDLDNKKIKKLVKGSATWTDITGNGDFLPGDVAVDSSGYVYVTSYASSKIYKLVNGKWIDITFGGRFNGPYDVAVDTSGNVYVADGNNNKIKMLPNGSTTWADISGNGEFNDPRSLAVDSSGNVYVTVNKKIKKLVSESSNWEDIYGHGMPLHPQSVALDNTGNLYVANLSGYKGLDMIKKLGLVSSQDLQASKPLAVFKLNSNSYICQDKTMIMDVAPFEINGRTYVPLRYLLYAIGAKDKNIIWDDKYQLVKIHNLSKENNLIQYKVGTKALITANTVVKIDSPPILKEGRVYLPARHVLEPLGYTPVWNQNDQTITVWPIGKAPSDTPGYYYNGYEIPKNSVLEFDNCYMWGMEIEIGIPLVTEKELVEAKASGRIMQPDDINSERINQGIEEARKILEQKFSKKLVNEITGYIKSRQGINQLNTKSFKENGKEIGVSASYWSSISIQIWDMDKSSDSNAYPIALKVYDINYPGDPFNLMEK
jgi:streptogramin lyase